MADIFREIDEDLRRDRMQELWRRYANLVYAGAALIVLVAGGISYWRYYQEQQAQDLAARYTAADNLAQDDQAKGTAALEVLAAQGESGYRLVARFRAAALKVKSGDKAAGLAAFRAIAADGGVDQEYRDLATLQAALAAVDDAPAADIIEPLKPLTIAPNPWRFTALEITALAQLRLGDRVAAQKTYQQIADDADAPQSLRTRATEIVAALSHQG